MIVPQEYQDPNRSFLRKAKAMFNINPSDNMTLEQACEVFKALTR